MSAVLLSVLMCLVVGHVLDAGLLGHPGRGPIERFGRALMLGLGATGAVSMLLDSLGVPVRALGMGIALAVLVLVLLPSARRAWRAARPAGARPEDALPRAAKLAGVGLLLFAGVSLGQAVWAGFVRPVFQFDSLTRWVFKAKALALDGTLLGPLSTDPAFALTHQRYPPLVCHVSNLPAMIGGVFDDMATQAMYPWFAVALAAIVYGVLRRRAGSLPAALGAAWVASLPLISYVQGPPPGAGAASAMADIPLGLFAAGAMFALVDALDGRRDRAHLETGLLLAFAALTKNEGLPLLAITVVAVCVFAPRARWRRALGIALVAAGLYWLLWGRIAAGLPALDEHYPGRLNLASLLEGLGRLPVVLLSFGQEMISFRMWNLTWPAIVLFVALGRMNRAVGALLFVLVLQLGSYVYAFLITAWTSPAAEAAGSDVDPVVYLIGLTLGRLLLHVAPIGIAAALLSSPRLTRASG
ncbi:MAG: hypothetical protein ACYTCU_00440 [Planctomycetota bacterium]|jgi:hypothetical protein